MHILSGLKEVQLNIMLNIISPLTFINLRFYRNTGEVTGTSHASDGSTAAQCNSSL